MRLPPAQDAAAWFLETVREALARGERIDLGTVLALRTIAPGDAAVAQAVERLDASELDGGSGDFAARARSVAAALVIAVDSRDDELGRQVVGDLERDLLEAFKPGESLGRFEDDVAMASLMLDIWHAGQQLPHQMMAEELMLIAIRRYWRDRLTFSFRARSEAAYALARLHRATGRREYYDYAAALLGDFAETYQQHRLEAGHYVLALQAIS